MIVHVAAQRRCVPVNFNVRAQEMEHAKGLSTAPTELDELQEIARIATRAALEEYERIPTEWEKNLTLGTLFDGDDRIFELYIAGERPSDAVVISSARVNRRTKSVSVAISNLSKKAHS